MAAELGRLTPRDRLLLDLLDQHRTFTTDQLVDLAFGSVGRARNRLNTLHDRDILDRFRHYQRPGSQAWRWTLGPVGAALLAAGRGALLPRPAAVRDATARLAMSPTLAHLLTVNGFFVALTAHARAYPGARLVRWWNEARCREACGNLVRPDGHGVWADNGRAVPFWAEVDLGTETLSRVVGKLGRYAALPPRRAYPVLFWLPTAAREANLHDHLRRVGLPDGVTVATATATADPRGPAGPVWRVVGHRDRVSLAELPAPITDGVPWDG
ncbi:replication-relaxation family protein [Micromonospora antibiotica]|uniref:Replication-relaxation family protein n=1 Tax=Micromonospora antibiotica TaxID=2807623 RepID=A0ABS3V810_9ACTN|nr:replication-relaxation family protein [Micromonospora antibiotica]MBO4161754.1 replication-relaxation family protein [Micromonospora antibiotica]